jgi:hypothetical protein
VKLVAPDDAFKPEKRTELAEINAKAANNNPLPVPTPTPDGEMEVPQDLRGRVSNLAQAIGSFSDTSGAAGDYVALPFTDETGMATVAASPGALTLGGMVDAMKQFDANGNPTVNPGATVAAATSLSLPGMKDPIQQGVLASGGKTS